MMTRHPMLALIPNDLLTRTASPVTNAKRAARLELWLRRNNVRATLLDIETERANRTGERNGQ